MTPQDWARMSWLARDRYRRRTRVPIVDVDVEPPIPEMVGMSVPELRALVETLRYNPRRAATHEAHRPLVINIVDLARALHDDLPKERDDIIAKRQEFLHSLDKRQQKGKR